MEKSLPGQQNYFEAFIKAAQYLAGLTTQQDIWSETGKVLVNFFGAEVGAVEERRANGEAARHRWVFSERYSSRRDLEAETREAIAEVLECGFLSARIIFTPDPLSIACFPITRENQVVAVMVVGHGMPEPIPRELLNVYLAVAGLVGTTVERLVSERELWRHRRQLQEEIVERKRAEEELKKHRDHLEELVKERTAELALAKEAAEAASRSKSDFLANMSHELRTPLNAIMGYAQILKKQKNLTDNQKDQISTIQSSAEHLLTLINDILDLARIEAQKEEVKIMEFNLPTLIHEVLSTIGVKAAEKDLSFHYEEQSAVPEIVRSDARKLRQVLFNLLDNAVKYTQSGSVTLRVSGVRCQVSGNEEKRLTTDDGSRTRDEEPESRVQFQVSDTGIGISEDRVAQIFEPFIQEHARDVSIEGTGLGLAISRRLVELMGGKLLVESEVGRGSTFTVELKMEVVEEVPAETIEPEKVVIGYEGERKYILIVDDNITNLDMLVSLLEPLGFEIDTAENGEVAVERAIATKPDIMLLDLLMPGMDGHETLRWISSDQKSRSIKVIGISAAVADKDRAEAFASDCDDFISKPVDTKVLLNKLAEQLRIEWIEAEDGGRAVIGDQVTGDPVFTKAAPGKQVILRSMKDEGAGPVKVPPRDVLEQIIQHAEWGEFTKLGKILDELKSEDAGYSSFCDRIRAYARRYDDEGIVEYIKSRDDR